MRANPGASVDQEQVSAIQELALAAELSYLWSSQLSRSLDAFAQAARAFLQDVQAGRDPDPVPLLVRFGAANELLDQISDRFEIGAEALSGLRFSLERSPVRVVQEAGEVSSNVILLRPEEMRSTGTRSSE